MILDDRNMFQYIKNAANYNNKPQEVFLQKNGSIVFGLQGIMLPMLRRQNIQVVRLGIIFPDGYAIPEAEKDIIIV